MNNRVVITGLGAVTPIGNDVNTFWENIMAGKCGIDFIKCFDTENYKAKLAAEVKDFDPLVAMDKKDAKRMDRFSQFAMVAAKEAVEDAGLDFEKEDPYRVGVVIGSGTGGIYTMETQVGVMNAKGPNRVSPFTIPLMIGNIAAGNVAIKYGLKGVCLCITTACATGTNAIGEAFNMIRDGRADCIIAGGSEASITPFSIAGFTSITALSLSADPLRASIPFDAERSGFIMGEGAGIIVLESLEHAEKRNAKIYGEVAGYGSTCDAYHMTAPSPDGESAARAMEEAIKDAEISPDSISYINAHGTGTYYNDKIETAAIKKVFSDKAKDIPVSSTKSMTGHLLGAAGAIEAVVCIKALNDGFLPPTIGYKVPDAECDLDYVINEGRKAELKYAMSNSLGFGGHNAVLVFKNRD